MVRPEDSVASALRSAWRELLRAVEILTLRLMSRIAAHLERQPQKKMASPRVRDNEESDEDYAEKAALLARPLEASPPLWERPEVCRLGTLAARFTATCQGDARGSPCDWRSSTWARSLRGYWGFELYETPDAALAAAEAEAPCGSSIEVPGAWQLQKAGSADKPIYTNIQYPIPVSDPPKMPARNPTAVYSKTFQVPEAVCRGERRVIVHVGAADNCAFCRAGGRWLAFWKDSRLPAEIDATDACSPDGKLEIRFVVLRWSDGAYLEDQDAWKLSGLIRDVYALFPPVVAGIFDVSWISNGDQLAVEVELWRASADEVEVEVRVEECGELPVRSCTHTQISDASRAVSTATSRPSGSLVRCAFRRKWKPWSAEAPYLYVVRALLRINGVLAQCEAVYFGHRRLDVVDGVLRLNSKRLVVAGANRHETCPRRGGPTVSWEDAERDVEILRRGNFNVVRTSHYPPSPAFLAACDRGGLCVVDEANIETHGMTPHPGTLADHPRWRQAFCSRLSRMIRRDRCHPSVLAWSLGNESGYGAWHRELFALARASDDRLVVYEPATWSADAPTDILCPMYARVDECRELLEERPGVPLVLSEYAHAMGNSCGGLDVYWRAFNDPAYPSFQGGCIWDMVDQGLWLDREGGFWAYGGDFGELPTDGTFCINGLLLPNREPKPTWHEAVAAQRPFGDLVVCGKADATVDVAVSRPRLDDLDFSWRVELDGVRVDGEQDALVLNRLAKSPADEALDVYEPFVLRCRLPARRPRPDEECWLTVTARLARDAPWAPKGFALGEAQLDLSDLVRGSSSSVSEEEEEENHHQAGTPERAKNARRLRVEVDEATGLPRRILVDGRDALAGAEISSNPPSGASDDVPVFLDALLAESEVGYGEVGLRGRLGYEGKRVVVAGRAYGRALSAHANSRLVIDLSEGALRAASGENVVGLSRLSLAAALNDDAAKSFPLVFKIVVVRDGRCLWSNEGTPLAMPGQIQTVDIDASNLLGATTVELIVESRWGPVDLAHAVWLDPVVWCSRAPADEVGLAYRYATGPVRLCFERAPTDNDRGGYLYAWRAAGLDEPLVLEDARRDGRGALLTLRPRRLDTALLKLHAILDDWFSADAPPAWESRLAPKLRHYAHAYAAANRLAHVDVDGGARIWRPATNACTTHPVGRSISAAQVRTPMEDDEIDEEDSSSSSSSSGAALTVTCRVETLVHDAGFCVQVSRLTFVSSGRSKCCWPSTLPRIGLALRVAPDFGPCAWLGRGPYETYPDRKLAGRVGRFEVRDVDDLYTEYVRPSTCANRTDTRRLDLGSLRIDRPGHFFDFALTRHSSSELAQARHQHELLPDPAAFHLNLDAMLMGVGGDDSWTASVHGAYLVRPPTSENPFAFEFRFTVGCDENND